MSRNPKKYKIDRIRKGGKPRVLDLFSGCGGLSLGFLRSGYQVLGGLEIDPVAAISHVRNFHNCNDIHSIPRDIVNTEPSDLVSEWGIRKMETSVDFLVGGPPCQAYARVGRAKSGKPS